MNPYREGEPPDEKPRRARGYRSMMQLVPVAFFWPQEQSSQLREAVFDVKREPLHPRALWFPPGRAMTFELWSVRLGDDEQLRSVPMRCGLFTHDKDGVRFDMRVACTGERITIAVRDAFAGGFSELEAILFCDLVEEVL